MSLREKDIYIFIGFLILLLFASIGILCSIIHIYKYCKYKYYKKDMVFVKNNKENFNPIV